MCHDDFHCHSIALLSRDWRRKGRRSCHKHSHKQTKKDLWRTQMNCISFGTEMLQEVEASLYHRVFLSNPLSHFIFSSNFLPHNEQPIESVSKFSQVFCVFNPLLWSLRVNKRDQDLYTEEEDQTWMTTKLWVSDRPIKSQRTTSALTRKQGGCFSYIGVIERLIVKNN